jgi:hypothetical protein
MRTEDMNDKWVIIEDYKGNVLQRIFGKPEVLRRWLRAARYHVMTIQAGITVTYRISRTR